MRRIRRASFPYSAPTWSPIGSPSSASGRLAEGSRGAWAPDGRRIYYDRNDSILWRPADGGLRRFVVADGRAPVPAPDGARVAFLRGRPPAVAPYVVELETGREARLTP